MKLAPILTTLLVALAGCAGDSDEPSVPVAYGAPVRILAGSAPRRADCLTDEGGLRLTAQVTKKDVRATSAPNGGSEGERLDFFTPFYFVFEKAPDGQSYLLGRTPFRDSVVGWCSADDLSLWPTRVGAHGRAVVYGSPDDLRERLRTGEGPDPIAISKAGSGKKPFLLPITATRDLDVGGDELEAWQVSFVGRKGGAPKERYTAAERSEHQVQISQCDCIWVVDGTGSMSPFWDAARERVAGITRRIARAAGGDGPSVRFGLVAFRDRSGREEPAARLSTFGDERSFLEALEEMEVDGGGDTPEAGLDALDLALESDWRPGQLSTRLVILVSDASFHEGASPAKNPRELSRQKVVERANELGVRVIGLSVGRRHPSADRELQLDQLRELAKGTGGADFAIEESGEAVSRIEAILRETAKEIDRTGRVYAALEEGATSAVDIGRITGIELDRVTDVLELLGGHLDLERLAPGEVAFSSGWVAPVWRGSRQLEMRVLISRAECEILRDACRRLIVDLGTPRSTGFVDLALGGRTGDGRALSSLVGDERSDMAGYLVSRYGVPSRRDSVLRLSQVELDHMPEVERKRRLDDVALALQRLGELERDDSNWFRGADGGDWAFLPEEVLP